MKKTTTNTGMIRHCDRLGRLVIPSEIRETLNIGEHTPILIHIDGDMICLKKYHAEMTYAARLEDIYTSMAVDHNVKANARIKLAEAIAELEAVQ